MKGLGFDESKKDENETKQKTKPNVKLEKEHTTSARRIKVRATCG